jgi:hypothetical protein
MSNLERRIGRAEEALSVGQEPIIVNIVDFSGGPLPSEQRRGNVIVRHVAYATIQPPQEGGAGHAH